MRTMNDAEETVVREPLIRWSAIFAGAVIGVATLVLLTALWIAIGFGSDVSWFADELAWLVGGSAIVAMFAAGLLAGWLSGARGPIVGFWHGMAVWGLSLVFLVGVTLPMVVGGNGFASPTSATSTAALSPASYAGATLWAFFWAVLVGLGSAALGGLIGGASPKVELTADERQRARDTGRTRLGAGGHTPAGIH